MFPLPLVCVAEIVRGLKGRVCKNRNRFLEDAVMKKLSTLLAVLTLLALTSNIFAQDEEEELEKDLLEVAVFGGSSVPLGGLSDWTCTTDQGVAELGTGFGFNVGFDVGYFLTAKMVLGLNLTYSQFTIDTDTVLITNTDPPEVVSRHHRIWSPSVYFKYYFYGGSNLIPYLKVHAGVDIPKFTTRVFDDNVGHDGGYEYRELSYDPVFAFGFGGGLFYYTHDYGGLYLEANLHNGFTKDSKADYQGNRLVFGETATTIDIHAGVKVFFESED